MRAPGGIFDLKGSDTGGLLSGSVSRDVEDLELDAVGVVEEDGVVAGRVGVLARAALDLGAGLSQPRGALVDRGARGGLECEVMEADGVPVVASGGGRL